MKLIKNNPRTCFSNFPTHLVPTKIFQLELVMTGKIIFVAQNKQFIIIRNLKNGPIST